MKHKQMFLDALDSLTEDEKRESKELLRQLADYMERRDAQKLPPLRRPVRNRPTKT